jgi:putative PEP-CTERM system histidine kinase
MNLLYLFNVFAGLVLLSVAALVIFKRRLSPYSRPFLFLILVNLTGIAAILIEISRYSSLWLPGYILLFFHISFLPYAWHLMAYRWGLDENEYSRRDTIMSRLFLAFSIILFVFMWVERGIDLETANGRWLLVLNNWRFWISAYLIIGLTSGAYAIEVCYRSSLGLARERIKRSFFPLLAYAIALLGAATVGILYGRIGDLMLTVIYLLFALVSVPVARHYILFNPASDGIILTRRGVYSSLVVVLFGVYFLIIGTVGEVLVKYNLDEGVFFSVVILILMVFTFLILVVSQTIRSRLRIVSGPQVPFRDKALYAAEWREFAEEVSVAMNMDAIYSRTSRLLHRLLKIDHSLFVIKEPAPSENYTLYTGDGIDRGIPGEQLNRLSDWLYRFGHAIEAATLAEKSPKETEQLNALEKTAPFKIFLLVPFVARQQSLGFWGIGGHSSGRRLSSDEIGFIEAAANPVSLTIMGARMTDELIISREIESFQRFSSFVLHDLKNSVAMLSMLMQNAEKNIGNPDFQQEALLTISKAVNRQKKIISRLTEEKAGEKLTLEKVKLLALVNKTLERVRLDTVKTVESQVTIDEGLEVIIDPDKIGSVFDNLVINAVEAMPDGGLLEIKAANSESPGQVAVSFTDAGVGMTKEFVSTRLFKPFSSTKPHGLGIGMYQSREIIRAHRGRIEVISEPGKGTEFLIYLPKEG